MPTNIQHAPDYQDAYARYRPQLVRYAERVLGDRSAAAEDVVHDAFLRAQPSLTSVAASGGVRPWLYAIVRNLAIDELRRQARVVPDPEAGEAAATALDVHALAARREELRHVVADVAALPEAQRRAFVAHAIDGTPHAVLAGRRGTSVGQSKNLVNRGRTRLAAARALRAAA